MKNILLKTNVLVCIIIVAGFLVTAVLSYQANYSSSLENIEQVSDLSSEGIYYQMNNIFTKPINISLTMANDSLLRDCLNEEKDQFYSDEYVNTIKEYLGSYQKKYNYDSVFLVSTETGRYYNFNGVDRIIERGNSENEWYYEFLDSDIEYSMNVDNDEAANDEITVFVNCKVIDKDNEVLGVVGVGLRIDYLQELLKQYERDFDVETYFINSDGIIEISADYSGYEKKRFFDIYDYGESVKGRILNWKKSDESMNLWAGRNESEKSYIVERYIPELSWHLVVERNTGDMLHELRNRLYVTMAIIAFIIAMILLIITRVIKTFNKKIVDLTEEKQETFRKATEQLYDSIYEWDITRNRAGNASTERFIESLNVPKDTPFDKALELIAEKQIKEEFRQGYIETFKPENVLYEFENGNNHLRYDFQITSDGVNYFWLRIDAHIFNTAEDGSIRMFTYRKNIDAQMKKELMGQMDEMTGIYTKTVTTRCVEKLLLRDSGKKYAFYIFDIDSFKNINDSFGHAFGDKVIIRFVDTIKSYFDEADIIGRIGGDEFVVFAEIEDEKEAESKAAQISRALDTTFSFDSVSCKMSSSIGVAISPRDGKDFDTLYKNADAALYQTKKRGKNSYTIFGS